jgi:YD repeat-containing protein
MNAVSRLLSVVHQQSSTTLDGASYAYDPAGNRISKTNYLDGSISQYSYDPLYQLTQVIEGTGTTTKGANGGDCEASDSALHSCFCTGWTRGTDYMAGSMASVEVGGGTASFSVAFLQ